MSVTLVYHNTLQEHIVSPFDDRAVSIARDSGLRIACPYLTLRYLERLVELSTDWKLLTDIPEWLKSLNRATERRSAADFISRNATNIRHSAGLHAKVLIGSTRAMVGSANFTSSGIQNRTEMSVFFEDQPQITELVAWFDAIWDQSSEVPAGLLHKFVESLPETPSDRVLEVYGEDFFTIRCERQVGLMPLIPVKTERRVLRYHVANRIARGYYIDGGGFCVMLGSTARGTTSRSFERYP